MDETQPLPNSSTGPAPAEPRHRVFVLPQADVRHRNELVTADDLAYWLDQQLLEGWELVAFGPQGWRPGSKDTVWIFRRIEP